MSGRIITDMPKLLSPFMRDVQADNTVTPVVRPGYEWVFTDPNVRAVEKLHGTNVSILLNAVPNSPNYFLKSVYNRMNHISTGVLSNHVYIKGIRNAHAKGYFTLNEPGQFFGELVGPNIHGNELELEEPIWFPFQYLYGDIKGSTFAYKCFHEHEKTFENLSSWFKDYLFSLVYRKFHEGAHKPPEGVVFYHPDGRMAKLRRDMFDWYEGPRHKQDDKSEWPISQVKGEINE